MQNNSQLLSLETLQNINKLYNEMFSYDIHKDVHNFELQNWRHKFDELLLYLIENHQKSYYKNLLVRYETSFVRIISLLNESGNINIEMTKELLMASRGFLDDFFEEVKGIQENEKVMNIKAEEVIRKRLLDEIEEERTLQKKFRINESSNIL